MTYRDAVLMAEAYANKELKPYAVCYDRSLDEKNSEKFTVIGPYEGYGSIPNGVSFLHVIKPEVQ